MHAWSARRPTPRRRRRGTSLLHGDEEVVFGNAAQIGVKRRPGAEHDAQWHGSNAVKRCVRNTSPRSDKQRGGLTSQLRMRLVYWVPAL